MAVHRDGLLEEDDEEENGVFGDEYTILESDSDAPPHLQALAAACNRGDVQALNIALDEFEGSINEPIEDGDTALHLTCLYGFFQCVQVLINRGADMNVRDYDGGIPLHDACAGGYVEIVQYLLDHANGPEHIKTMLETVDYDDDTPLHHAARGEHAEIIRILLAAGAPTTAKNRDGKTPRELVERNEEAKTILDSIVTQHQQ